MSRERRRIERLLQQHRPFCARYELGEMIGSGSYSLIFRALDRGSDTPVAVKVITFGAREGSDTAEGRFRREMKVIRSLNHPNIISIHDWGWMGGGTLYMVLEYISGQTLDEVVRSSPMDEGDGIAVARQIVAGLQAAHESDVIHRDLKPANVMLTSSAGRWPWKVKILDFGLAKLLSSPEDESIVDLTADGMAVGTPRYIAPEQARGEPVGPPADLYAVGLLMYEIFTGRRLVTGDSVEEAVVAHVSREPWRLQGHEGLPESMVPILHRLLDKDPYRRVDSASRLLEMLDNPGSVADSGPEDEQWDEWREDSESSGVGPRRYDRTGSVEVPAMNGVQGPLQVDNTALRPLEVDGDDGADQQQWWESLELSGMSLPFRRPRNGFHWLELTVAALLVVVSFLAVGAQMEALNYGARLLAGLAAPLAALGWASVTQNDGWNGSFARTGWICCGIAAVGAHLMGPSSLAQQLLSDPAWFLAPVSWVPGVGYLESAVSEISRQWALALIELGWARLSVG